MKRLALTWIAGFGLYLLFVGQPTGAEYGAAAITASFAAGLVLFLERRGSARMRPYAPWFTLLVRLARSITVDTVRVARVLGAAIAGHAIRGPTMKQPFQPGPVAPASNARRGIVILLASLAPNGFVLDLEAEPPALLLHRLAPAPRSPDELWPV